MCATMRDLAAASLVAASLVEGSVMRGLGEAMGVLVEGIGGGRMAVGRAKAEARR